MKNLIIKSLSIALFTFTGDMIAKAQTENQVNSKTPATSVPENIESHFKSAYKKAGTVEWQQSGSNYKVMFTDENNLHHTVLYDREGQVIGKESEMDEQTVPKTIREYFVNNFPAAETYRVWRIEDETGKISFYSPVKDAVVFFKEDGTFDRRDERLPENIEQK
ncbi:MAG: PepSY-like domain-containing protein [Chitinophagales bacterium]|nr:PepSY-like domain-containing protein [Chitinophagales bacterium]